MTKPTKAQRRFLREHLNDTSEGLSRRGRYDDGYRPRLLSDRGAPTYVFVGNCRDAGFVEIDNGKRTLGMGWPYAWDGTRLTDAGREAAK